MHQHDDFIEKLSEETSLNSFLALSLEKLNQQVEQLIQRVFRKTDFALASVVNSLFEHQGPLADFTVQLKLLLGLGVISDQIYEDINKLYETQLALTSCSDDLAFSNAIALDLSKQLNYVDHSTLSTLFKQLPTLSSDSMLFQIQQHRLEKAVRSSFILALAKILEQLGVESPL